MAKKNFSGSWRGVVGIIKPTYRPGSLEEFIRLLPEGIGVIPKFVDVREGLEKEFVDAFALAEKIIGELAEMKVDLIHPEGAPLFVQKGYSRSEEIVSELGRKIFHSNRHDRNGAGRGGESARDQQVARDQLI